MSENEKLITETSDAFTCGARSVEADLRWAKFNVFGVEIPLLTQPNGEIYDPHELLRLAEAINPPRRHSYRLDDIASVCRWARRYYTEELTAFIDTRSMQLEVIADELPAKDEDGAHRGLRASMSFALSVELQRWLGIDNTSVKDFIAFVDVWGEQLQDAALISAMLNFESSSTKKWTRKVDADGTVRAVAEEANSTVKVPRKFKLLVPIFKGDQELYEVDCKLVMRDREGGGLTFKVEVPELQKLITQRTEEFIGLLTTAGVKHIYRGC